MSDVNFAADSLFCEWCYVLDLDQDVLEVHKGFNKRKLSKKARFYFLEPNNSVEYHPVKLLKRFPLAKLEESWAEFLAKDEKGEVD